MVFLQKFCGLPQPCIFVSVTLFFLPQSERYQILTVFPTLYPFHISFEILISGCFVDTVIIFSWCILYLRCFWEEQHTNSERKVVDSPT